MLRNTHFFNISLNSKKPKAEAPQGAAGRPVRGKKAAQPHAEQDQKQRERCGEAAQIQREAQTQGKQSARAEGRG